MIKALLFRLDQNRSQNPESTLDYGVATCLRYLSIHRRLESFPITYNWYHNTLFQIVFTCVFFTYQPLTPSQKGLRLCAHLYLWQLDRNLEQSRNSLLAASMHLLISDWVLFSYSIRNPNRRAKLTVFCKRNDQGPMHFLQLTWPEVPPHLPFGRSRATKQWLLSIEGESWLDWQVG